MDETENDEEDIWGMRRCWEWKNVQLDLDLQKTAREALQDE